MLASLRSAGSGDVELDQVSWATSSPSRSKGPGDVRATGRRARPGGHKPRQRQPGPAPLKAVNVNLSMSGPGDVSLSGVAGEMSAEISGSGDLNADALRLTKLNARLRGPGTATLPAAAPNCAPKYRARAI